MLYRILEAHGGALPEGVVCCFANTGKEMEETLRFVKRCGDEWGVRITWLEYMDAAPRWREVTFETASRDGEPFEALIGRKKYLPNPVARFCTEELKVKAINAYLVQGLGWEKDGVHDTHLVGIRADEKRRVSKVGIDKCPLVKAGVTKQDVWAFWAKNDFDLELPIVDGGTKLGNCDLCFLKGAVHLQSLVAEEPKRAIWWAGMEAKVGATFRNDRPGYRQMYEYALAQKDWIGHDAIDDSIGCFCGD